MSTTPACPDSQQSVAEQIDALTDPDFMTSLARGRAALPAHESSSLAVLEELPDEQLDAYLARTELLPRTEHTITDKARLRAVLDQAKRGGYAINNEELELGLRSIAVPVRGASGRVPAALNVGAQALRVTPERMLQEFLPVLRQGAQELAVLLP